MAWDVRYENGLWLPQIGWWLDAHFPVAKSFVSHAHFDHVAPHQVMLMSEGTARLTRARMPGERREIILPYDAPHALTPDCTARLVPAGHIYGSAQFHATSEHGTLLYTGDFNLRPGLSAEACATPRADLLIMETTFGLPRYVFPPTEQVLGDIVAFCQQALHDHAVPVLFGYSLGKSQELLQALGRAQLPVMLHQEIFRLTQVYESLGMTFPPYRLFDAFECGGHVVLCPPQAAGSSCLRKIEHRRTAMITGWATDVGAKFRYQCDAAFPLSDHADFPDLLRFVELVQPTRVLTLHGFAREFAQTLRERGIEAWAVGQDNQLELSIGSSSAAPTPPPAQCPPMANVTAAANSLAQFAVVAEAVKSTASKLEKVAALENYLAALDADVAALAAVFFTGRPFPQADARTLNVGWSLLQRAVLHAAHASEPDFRAAYGRFRDSGDTAEALLAARGLVGGAVSLSDFANELAALAAERGPTGKLARLQTLFERLSAAEAKYVVKIITGDLRIGLKEGLVEEAIAAATSRNPEAVREANLICGDLGEVMRAAKNDRLDAIELRVFRPLQFMLASPEPTASAILARLPPPVWLEEKYDGIRCQVHKLGSRVELFSRDLNNITTQFPDLARAAASIGCDFIADGELLAWRNGRALPFAELQKRLGRKGEDFFLGEEIPVSLSLYDLLWVDGHVLLKLPLRERRTHLEAIIPATHARVVIAPITRAETELEIEAAFLRARQRGNEGLMAKDPASLYSPGRRGLAWLKLKKTYATLDVVVVGVEYGHGKRRDVLSDYTFAIRDEASGRLFTVGKAYSGLADTEIAQLTMHFLEHTLEVHGRYRVVEPNVVLEVAFDIIQPSKRHQSGYALRFPRIARIRTDKSPAEIDTLATCRKLAGVEPAAV
jgi:DNA ligase-1